jgi:hypothetical protein
MYKIAYRNWVEDCDVEAICLDIGYRHNIDYVEGVVYFYESQGRSDFYNRLVGKA